MTIKENKYLIFDSEQKIGLKYLAKIIVNFLDRTFYGTLYKFIKQKDCNDNKYKVSLCAIFKDEADYLKEWIEYHLIAGVEHFYLYNHESTDNYYEVIKKYIDKGIITLIDWKNELNQMQAYQHWSENYKNESKWVGFIDLDEFVVPNEDDNIYDFLQKYENRSAVIIYWKYFGSSGFKSRDIKRLVTEDFVIGWYKYANIGKYFFNTKFDYIQKYWRNKAMHEMWGGYKGIMFPPVNVFDNICTCSINPVNTYKMPIQINHYLLKSYDEYMYKKMARDGADNFGQHDVDYYYYHESFSNKEDKNIYKYLDELKENMNEKE